MTDVALPDHRRVRRAVRWGVVRTAGGAVGWVFGILVFLSMAGMVFDAALDHRNRFERVVGTAFVASQPDYEWGITTPSTAAPFMYGNTMKISGRLRGVDQDWAAVRSESLYQSALGHLGYTTAFPQGPVTEALKRGRPERGATSALLARLPAHSRAVAIVELRTPFAWDDARAIFPTQLPAMDQLVWLEEPYRELTFDGPVLRHPLTWANPNLRQRSFRTWVRELRDSDAGNLRPFGLPSIAELRAMAQRPLIYAYLTETVDVAELATIVRRPDVASLRLVDVRLPVA
jgi:hypothetical protein